MRRHGPPDGQAAAAVHHPQGPVSPDALPCLQACPVIKNGCSVSVSLVVLLYLEFFSLIKCGTKDRFDAVDLNLRTSHLYEARVCKVPVPYHSVPIWTIGI